MSPRVGREFTYTFKEWATCPMCGTPRSRFRRLGRRLNGPQGLWPRGRVGITTTIVRCRDCGLIFANPQPAPTRLEDHYDAPPESYWHEEYFAPTKGYFDDEIGMAFSLLGRKREEPLRALDIGAGIGKGMQAMAAAGMDVWGIEPSPSFRKAAVEGTRIPPERIIEAPMEDAELEVGGFDFVTFGAVLEHLQDPGRALVRALGWLRAGGALHAEVPSSDWLMARVANFYFRLTGTDFVTHISPMHPPYHLFEFTPESFRRHGLRQGYRVERVERFVCGSFVAARAIDAILRRVMRATNTGMQLGLWIRKEPSNERG